MPVDFSKIGQQLKEKAPEIINEVVEGVKKVVLGKKEGEAAGSQPAEPEASNKEQ